MRRYLWRKDQGPGSLVCLLFRGEALTRSPYCQDVPACYHLTTYPRGTQSRGRRGSMGHLYQRRESI